MFRLTIGCVLAAPFVAVAGPVLGRSFPEANCAFSLPGPDWEWLDPAQAPPGNSQCIAFARNHAGVNFWLKFHPIPAGAGVGPDSYRNVERSLTSHGQNWTRLGSKYITFKGVPAYQIDFRTKENTSSGRFVFLFADNRAYTLAVETPAAELGPEADAVLDRFTFLSPPHPMMEPHDESDIANPIPGVFGAVGGWLVGLGSAGFVLLLLFGAWAVIRIRG